MELEKLLTEVRAFNDQYAGQPMWNEAQDLLQRVERVITVIVTEEREG